MTISPPQGRRDAPPPRRTPDEVPGFDRDRTEGNDNRPVRATTKAIKERSMAPLAAEARKRATKPLVPIWDAAKKPLTPVAQAGAALAGAGAFANELSHTPGSVTPMVLATVVAGPVTWYLGRKTIERQMDGESAERVGRARRFVSAAATAGAGWMASAAAFGVDPSTAAGKVNITVGGLIGLWAASPYVRFRNQPKIVATIVRDEIVPDDDEEEFEETEQAPIGFAARAAHYRSHWAGRVAVREGALPGTSLDPDAMVEIEGGWTGKIVSDVPGTVDPQRFIPATGKVAAAFEVGVSDVTIEVDSANSSQATLTMLHDNPLTSFQNWPGPYAVMGPEQLPAFDTATGVAVIGVHSDGDLVRYRFWNSGGAWHDLISGATGSGKSEFVSLLLAYERHAVVEVPLLDDNQQPVIDPDTGEVKKVKKGLIVSRIGDPQWGQSFGDWQEHVDWFAPTIDEIRLMLQKTEREMYARNKEFGGRRWYDERIKRWRKGIKNFPLSPDMPLIVITIDEAHEVLKDPECARIVALLGKMGRKTGIKLRLITQVPLLQELGNNMAIRDAVASGNVVVFRTANSLSGPVAFSGALPAQPNTIPREWPKGRAKPGQETTAGIGYALGPSARPVIMRAFFPGDAIDWIYKDGEDWGLPGVLDPVTRAAGKGYEDRAQRLAELQGTDLDELAMQNASRGSGMTGAQAVLAVFLSRRSEDFKLKLEQLTAKEAGITVGPRQISNILTDFVKKGWVIAGSKTGALPYGFYQLTPKGREEAPDQLSVEDAVEDPAADEIQELANN